MRGHLKPSGWFFFEERSSLPIDLHLKVCHGGEPSFISLKDIIVWLAYTGVWEVDAVDSTKKLLFWIGHVDEL